MKTSLTLLAAVAGALWLSAGAASAAVSPASLGRVSGYVDGSEFERQSMPFMSLRSVESVRAEAAIAARTGFGYVEGSEYELAHQMFMSRQTRAQVRAEIGRNATFAMAALDREGGGH